MGTIGSRRAIRRSPALRRKPEHPATPVSPFSHFPVVEYFFPKGVIVGEAISYLTLDGKGRATLPEDVRRSLGLTQGDLVLLERTERGTYELVPATLVPRDQLWFHHPAVRSRVARAEADLAAGCSESVPTPEDAQALLDRLKRKRARR